MNSSHVKRLAVAAVVAMAMSGGVAVAAASGPASSRVWTPNDCVRLNRGDYNACNVGNSGRGDLPYRPVHVK